MKFLVIFACFLGASLSDPVAFKDCGSKSGKLVSVDITPCPELPCALKHNTNISLVVNFTSGVDTEKAATDVHGIIAHIPTPFPLPKDACQNNNVACPIKNGATVSYTNHLSVLQSYPKLSLIVQWELKDQSNNDLFCFVIPAVITD